MARTTAALPRQRLDQALVERGLLDSRQAAQALIRAGEVRIDGRLAEQADQRVSAQTRLEVRKRPPFVSRGGEKLAGALQDLGITVTGRVCLDAGASTGGFTDALLQAGAAHVYAVDVGRGQLDWRLRQDARVTVMERTNVRTLQHLPGAAPSLVVVDLSFISLRTVLPALSRLAAPHADLLLLFKPQFEVGRGRVGKGGVVRDEAERETALRAFLGWAGKQGFAVRATAPSRLRGAKGNQETFVWMGTDGS
jgi:23S rRNA (cytidine1920-2'-O)/16S rRNA (cytidine1409-2'-O)-methyltransferase